MMGGGDGAAGGSGYGFDDPGSIDAGGSISTPKRPCWMANIGIPLNLLSDNDFVMRQRCGAGGGECKSLVERVKRSGKKEGCVPTGATA